MSLGLALPSRPRAIRVIGSQAKVLALDHGSAGDECPQPPAGAPWAAALERFVSDEPAAARKVLENWLTDNAPADEEVHDVHG